MILISMRLANCDLHHKKDIYPIMMPRFIAISIKGKISPICTVVISGEP
jgi:hypothetical protein